MDTMMNLSDNQIPFVANARAVFVHKGQLIVKEGLIKCSGFDRYGSMNFYLIVSEKEWYDLPYNTQYVKL